MIENEDLIYKELIFLDYEVKDKEEALNSLSRILIEKGYAKESYTEEILKREEVYPTGLNTAGVKVAIPHTDSIHVNKAAILVARLKNPVVFKEMGSGINDVVVSLIFMLAVINPNHQVKTLGKLMNIFCDEKMLKNVYDCETSDEVFKILSNLLK